MSRSNDPSTSNPSLDERILSVSAEPSGSVRDTDSAWKPLRRKVRRTTNPRDDARTCRAVLDASERRTARLHHENAGFLSASRGFLPLIDPLERLSPEFAAWDQLASELPRFYTDLSLRRRVEQLPLLDASEACLDDKQLLRACALMAIVAQAYWNVEVRPPQQLPIAIAQPWSELRRRLGREQEVLSYIDLIVYNWRVVDPTLPDPFQVENLRLLIPTVDNREERVFYLTQLEMIARCAPLVRWVTSAQDAVLGEDKDALEEALTGIIHCLSLIVTASLPKINPNPFATTHVDPVVWAKTVAPFAVPIHAGDQGPSGTSSPIFNTLDLFFGRKDYASFLGREIVALRSHYPESWRAFLEAIGRVSVSEYIERSGSETLRGAWREAFELYVGGNGFLGRHRMKVYGFLELAFKVGRSVTIGGFGGVFKDRTWDQVDNELEASRSERLRVQPAACREAVVQSPAPAPGSAPSPVRHLTLDISRAGVRYGAGDRCAIYPENGPIIIERTLAALRANGNEPVALTDEWRAAAAVRRELAGKSTLPLRDVLRLGSIRPVTPRVAEALHAMTQSESLLAQIRRRCTERWELWELIQLLGDEGLDPVQLWSEPGVHASERLCRIVPPERFRIYSVASAAPSPLGRPATTLDLVVGHLEYRATEIAATEPGATAATEPGAAATAESGATPSGCPRHQPAPPSGCPMHQPAPPSGCPMHDPARLAAHLAREGTASSFLARAERDHTLIPFHLERPARFQPPRDPRTPIVFFAGGTGVSPFLSFLADRLRQPQATPCSLFWSLRTPRDLIGAKELEAALAVELLDLDVCFTREPAALRFDGDALVVEAGTPRRITDTLLESETAQRLWRLVEGTDGPPAVLYVCGRSGFARSVVDALVQIFRRCFPGTDEQRSARAGELLHRLVANNRLFFEVHSDAQPAIEEPRWIDVSDVAEHNEKERGYWMIIDRVVYDLTEFADLHPGGRRVVEAYSGMDATHGYARAHNQRPEVDAMREMYRIGMLREPDFDDFTTEVQGPSGPVTISCRTAYHAWVQALWLCVEMQNALAADYSLQDARATAAETDEEPGIYKLSRGPETHLRYLEFYQRVLELETLPGLWRVSQGLFAPDHSPDWMGTEVATLRASTHSQELERFARSLVKDFLALSDDAPRLRAIVDVFRESDQQLLADLKSVLLRGVRAFERHGTRTRMCGARELREAATALLGVFERAGWKLSHALSDHLELLAFASRPSSIPPASGAALRRSYTSPHWILDERCDTKLSVLQRTPAAWTSLAELGAESDAILGGLSDEQRDHGLLVDMRQSPIRNDADFENAMARLREGLTQHFKRTAVLLDTKLGELQVSRLERDERRNTLATRSESEALKFLSGGR